MESMREAEIEKLNTVMAVCDHFLSSRKPEAKIEEVKDEMELIYKVLLEYASLGHHEGCDCPIVANIFKKPVDEHPGFEFVLMVDINKKLLAGVGMQVLNSLFMPFTEPVETDFDKLTHMSITPYACVKFVRDAASRMTVSRMVTQPEAKA